MTHARFPRAPPHPQASPPLWLTAGGLPALQARPYAGELRRVVLARP